MQGDDKYEIKTSTAITIDQFLNLSGNTDDLLKVCQWHLFSSHIRIPSCMFKNAKVQTTVPPSPKVVQGQLIIYIIISLCSIIICKRRNCIFVGA